MIVKPTIAKLSEDRVGVRLGRTEHTGTLAKEYDSEQGARDLLLQIGIPKEALDFYFWQLLPCLEVNQELALPEVSISECELW